MRMDLTGQETTAFIIGEYDKDTYPPAIQEYEDERIASRNRSFPTGKKYLIHKTKENRNNTIKNTIQTTQNIQNEQYQSKKEKDAKKDDDTNTKITIESDKQTKPSHQISCKHKSKSNRHRNNRLIINTLPIIHISTIKKNHKT